MNIGYTRPRDGWYGAGGSTGGAERSTGTNGASSCAQMATVETTCERAEPGRATLWDVNES